MGYEYEIDSPDFGPPGSVTTAQWQTHTRHSYHATTFVRGTPIKKKAILQHPIRDLPKYFHVSYEGLGGGYGYEIKSVIAPLSIHKLLARRYLFPNVTFNTQPNGRDNNGGIHVSISINDLTQPHHLKVFDFLHNKFKRSHAFKLSERSRHSMTFCEQSPETNAWHGHYSLITKENTNRYEFRLFAAQQHLLLPALEMADSLFSLAQETEVITLGSWTNFINTKTKYKDIAEHVKRRLG